MAAPEPQFVSGRKGCVYINGLDLSKFFNSFEFGQVKGTFEANTFRSESKRKLDDLPDSSSSGEGFWDPQKRAIARELDRAVKTTDLSHVIWMPGGDDTVGDEGYAGKAIVTDNTAAGATDEAVGINFEAETTDPGREFVESLHPLADETVTADGTGLDNDVSTALGGGGWLQVMEADGTGTIDVIIEQSPTGLFAAEETTLVTFAQVSVTAGVIDVTTPITRFQRVDNANTVTVQQFLRAAWTITTITRATFFVGYARRVTTI